jgi:hypothetical protein
MSYITIGGVHYTREEYDALMEEEHIENLAKYRAQQEAEARAKEEGERACGRIGPSLYRL